MNEIIGQQFMVYIVLMAKLIKIYENMKIGGFLSRNLFAPRNKNVPASITIISLKNNHQ